MVALVSLDLSKPIKVDLKGGLGTAFQTFYGIRPSSWWLFRPFTSFKVGFVIRGRGLKWFNQRPVILRSIPFFQIKALRF